MYKFMNTTGNTTFTMETHEEHLPEIINQIALFLIGTGFSSDLVKEYVVSDYL